MATENFPTLSRDTSYAGYEEARQTDPTIRTRPEDGEVITRARTTALKKSFKFRIEYLTDADKTLLETFENTVKIGATAFNWTRYKQAASTAFVVRLMRPIVYRIMPNDPTLWAAHFEMEEV